MADPPDQTNLLSNGWVVLAAKPMNETDLVAMIAVMMNHVLTDLSRPDHVLSRIAKAALRVSNGKNPVIGARVITRKHPIIIWSKHALPTRLNGVGRMTNARLSITMDQARLV